MLFKKLAISSWTETESGGKIKIMGKCLFKNYLSCSSRKAKRERKYFHCPQFLELIVLFSYNAASQGNISSTYIKLHQILIQTCVVWIRFDCFYVPIY
jgi:hypothetical protein